ncbi:MAG: hypothetical protein M0P11_03305 [Anaerolineaceae bacterium]|jgi:hypothetical protein|nr:hypothetical protein [Anaerolineaceae bacterium]
MRLFSYKLTHDTGFAPNPFYGVLTLATCKPGIRLTKMVGDWLAGFSSSALHHNAKPYGVDIDPDALIYLARVSEVIPLNRYFEDRRFKAKIPPRIQAKDSIACSGDNIYKPLWIKEDGAYEYEQVSQIHHDDAHMATDLSGKNALVCDEFYYLGREGVLIPVLGGISRPKGPTQYGYKTEDDTAILNFVRWIKSEFKTGINGMPCMLKAESQKGHGSNCS